MSSRRDFISQLGTTAAASFFDLDELRAGRDAAKHSAWDTSWIDKLKSAEFKVVFNATDIADGAAMNYAAGFYGDYHEVHNTTDEQTRPVIVFRRKGTPMAFNDAMWEKYAIGEDTETTDSSTKAPAKRNVFWRGTAGDTIENLHKRGMISLVCNVATNNIGRRFATQLKLNVEDVQKDLKANLVPGAILVPSGIYALIHTQNLGCAYMPGT